MGLEAMTKTEMIEILRGKKLLKAPENNDELLEGLKMLDTIFDEIADELEQSEKVVHGHWGSNGIKESMLSGCSVCGFSCGAHSFNFCPNCGARMDEVSYE